MFSSSKKKKNKKLLIFLIIVIISIYGYIEEKKEQSRFSDASSEIENPNYVHFIEAGQGDCTLIETHDGKFAMIDASTQDYADEIIAYLFSEGVQELEFVLFTHPHEDHIGGGDEILKEFKVNTVYMNDFVENTACYERLISAIKDSKMKHSTRVFRPLQSDTFYLDDIEFTVLSDGSKYDDANNSSLCLKMELGESTFIFTGDAEKVVEYDILSSGVSVDAEVYKCGHHGSSTSNSDAFLNAVSPELAIISCGLDNSYGHPHVETIEALLDRNITSYRTDVDGTITVAFNEKSFTVAQNSAS